MTNTRNTPVEALEADLPLRIETYGLREGSGGGGRHRGGEGIRRTYRFLTPATVTINSERRRTGPYGLRGGEPGQPGRNLLIREDNAHTLEGKVTLRVEPGDQLVIETPGGGGWGKEIDCA
jgi:N-methylhydantoinase B